LFYFLKDNFNKDEGGFKETLIAVNHRNHKNLILHWAGEFNPAVLFTFIYFSLLK